jgi:serine/threonine protein kinase
VLNKICSRLGTKSLFEFARNYDIPKPHIKNYPARKFSKVPEEASDLLYKMLEIDPYKRVMACEALNHEYFRGVDI